MLGLTVDRPVDGCKAGAACRSRIPRAGSARHTRSPAAIRRLGRTWRTSPDATYYGVPTGTCSTAPAHHRVALQAVQLLDAVHHGTWIGTRIGSLRDRPQRVAGLHGDHGSHGRWFRRRTAAPPPPARRRPRSSRRRPVAPSAAPDRTDATSSPKSRRHRRGPSVSRDGSAPRARALDRTAPEPRSAVGAAPGQPAPPVRRRTAGRHGVGTAQGHGTQVHPSVNRAHRSIRVRRRRRGPPTPAARRRASGSTDGSSSPGTQSGAGHDCYLSHRGRCSGRLVPLRAAGPGCLHQPSASPGEHRTDGHLERAF